MLLYEALFNEESTDYFEAQKHLYPLVWDVKMALKAISNCDIKKLQTILNKAENRNKKYSESYRDIEEKLWKVLNFMKNFYKYFSEMVNESVLNDSEDTKSAIAGNIINLIVQDRQLGYEESLVILHSLRPIAVNRKPASGRKLMSDIYFTGLSICERYNIYGMNFAIIVSSNDNWSIDQFIRGCNPRLDKIIYRGLSSILRSKAEIRRLNNDLKDDLKKAYRSLLLKKAVSFSLIERYRASLL